MAWVFAGDEKHFDLALRAILPQIRNQVVLLQFLQFTGAPRLGQDGNRLVIRQRAVTRQRFGNHAHVVNALRVAVLSRRIDVNAALAAVVQQQAEIQQGREDRFPLAGFDDVIANQDKPVGIACQPFRRAGQVGVADAGGRFRMLRGVLRQRLRPGVVVGQGGFGFFGIDEILVDQDTADPVDHRGVGFRFVGHPDFDP